MGMLAVIAPAVGVVALIYAFLKTKSIKAADEGNERMQKIGKAIAEGAMAFLKREYQVLIWFVVIVAGLLGLANYGKADSSLLIAFSFVVGAFASGLAGFIGMKVATAANTRTTHAAQKGLPQALKIAFGGGAVMGMSVVGLALMGLGGLFLLYTHMYGDNIIRILNVLTGFSLGASSIALFARVGGGIYTKAADVGADLVGKVEAGIPEDHPLNPATIADNVGDNVGDVAGMGADLFESYVGAIIGSMVLGAGTLVTSKLGFFKADTLSAVYLPLMLAAAGILVSILGTFFVRTKEGKNPQNALNIGTFGAAGVMIVVSYFIISAFIPYNMPSAYFGAGIGNISASVGIFLATILGLLVGTFVGISTEYYCAVGRGPVNRIQEQSRTGSATNIISGLGLGMQSTTIPILLIAAGIVGLSLIHI